LIFPIDEMGITCWYRVYKSIFTSSFGNDNIQNKLQRYIILGFTCGWFVRLENIS
jgi:hypothetical protein